MAVSKSEAAPAEGAVLREYYGGDGMPCPVQCGERADVVRVSTNEDGSGVLWVECASCAQRESYHISPPTTSERKKVREMVESGREPSCPRHDPPVALARVGRRLICPGCGVRYRD